MVFSYAVFVILPASSVLADVVVAGGLFVPEGAVAVFLAAAPLALIDVAASVPVHAAAVAEVEVPFADVVVAGGPVDAHSVAFLAGDAVQVVRVVLRDLDVAVAMVGRLVVDCAQLWTSFHSLTQRPTPYAIPQTELHFAWK